MRRGRGASTPKRRGPPPQGWGLNDEEGTRGGEDGPDIFGLTCQGDSVKYPGVISNC
jgi:hypothetical protein